MFRLRFRKPPAAEGKLELRSPGGGKKVRFGGSMRGAERLLWVSPEQDAEGRPIETREPHEHARTYAYPGGFEAAGRRYKSLTELTATKLDGD